MSTSPRIRSVSVVCGLACLVLLFFWRVLFGRQALYWADLALQFYPWRRFAASTLLHNQLPLWNPYVCCGSPFLANLQSAVFYPGNFLWLGLPADRGLVYHSVLHVFLAGAFMFAYLRHLRLCRGAALVGGVAFMFSAFFVCRLTFPSMASVAVWLPLAFLVTDRLWRHPGPGWAAGLAAVTAVQLLGGHLQLSAMLLLAVFGLVVVRTVQTVRRHAGRAYLFVLWSGGAIGLGILLAAIQLLPTAEFVAHSARAAASFDFLTRYSLPPWQLVTLLVPDAFGHPALNNYWGEGNYWELCPYFGAVGFALALTGLTQVRRHARDFFGVMFIAGLLLALGRYTPLYRWVVYDVLPGFHSFKAPARFLFLSTFSGAVLAALGTDHLLAQSRIRARFLRNPAVRPLLAVTGLCIVWTLVWIGFGPLLRGLGAPWLAACLRRTGATFPVSELPAYAAEAYSTLLSSLLLTTVVLITAGVAVRLHLRGTMHRPAFLAGLIALTTLDLVAFGIRVNPTTDHRFFTYRPPQLAVLPAGAAAPRFLPRPDVFTEAWGKYVNFMRFGRTDYAHVRRLVDTLTPNLNMWFDVPSAEGYDPLELDRYNRYLLRAQDRFSQTGDTAPLALLNIRYLETYGIEPNAPGLRCIRHTKPRLYELTPTLPRVYLLPDRPEWFSSSVTGAGEALLAARRSRGRAVLITYGAMSVRIRCQSPTPALLVLADTLAPGWRAFLHGRSVPVQPAFQILRAVRVPAGEEYVEFVYLPISFRLGAFLSLLGLALLAALLAAQAATSLGPFPGSILRDVGIHQYGNVAVNGAQHRAQL